MATKPKEKVSGKSPGIIKLIAVNCAVLIAIYIISLIAISLGDDVWTLTKPLHKKPDIRANSQAFKSQKDKTHAQQVFADARKGTKDYRPFTAWRQKPITTPSVTIDANGYRRHTIGAKNAPDAITLGFFGNSTMWGVGADDNHTIPALFDASTTRFKVTNYAERGYTTRQNIAQLINLINQGKMPKIVVFYTGAGDVLMHCNYTITRTLNSHQEEQRLRQMVDHAGDSRLYANLMQPFIGFFQQFGKNRADAGQQACSTDPKRARAVAAMMIKNWDIAQQLVTANGGQFYAVLQPNLYVGKPARDHVTLKKKQRRRGGELVIVYPLVQAMIAQRASNWMTDLSAAFDGKGPIYLDDVHISPEGNKIIAEKIRDIVLKRLARTR